MQISLRHNIRRYTKMVDMKESGLSGTNTY